MSKYKGLFTFDEDNHRYVPIAQADGIIDTMDYEPDSEPKEPLIKDEKKLDAVKSFFALLGISKEIYYQPINKCFYKTNAVGITYGIDFDDDKGLDYICTGLPYTITELCGEGEECGN